MEFEDLKAIWDTQNDRPVFSMNDSRLAVALYQQREHSRRRLFREVFAPAYVMALFIAAGSGLLFLVFSVKTISRMRLTDPQMSVWDGAALVAAMAAAVAVAVPMYTERRKHERTQNVFAPSLREELERGISQLDFEVGLYNTRRGTSYVAKICTLVSFATAVFLWEIGRLNGDRAPWTMLAYALVCAYPGFWSGFNGSKEIVEGLMERKRALERIAGTIENDGRSEGELPYSRNF